MYLSPCGQTSIATLTVSNKRTFNSRRGHNQTWGSEAPQLTPPCEDNPTSHLPSLILGWVGNPNIHIHTSPQSNSTIVELLHMIKGGPSNLLTHILSQTLYYIDKVTASTNKHMSSGHIMIRYGDLIVVSASFGRGRPVINLV